MSKQLQAGAGLLALLCVAPAQAGDFLDTRLSFVFADDNVLAGPGETSPNSPTPGFGAGNQNNQFYDNFNTRFSGFETLSHVVLYTQAPSFFEGLTTEAAFAILALQRPSGGIDLRDDSSYVRLAWRASGWGDKESLSLTAFPISADRFRLGYAYRISWGGSTAFTNRAVEFGVPGVKLQLSRERWYLFAGAKTGQLQVPLQNQPIIEKVRLYGWLGGGGVDVLPVLRLEAGGGYFQKGPLPGLANQNVYAPDNAMGASAQAVFHVGEPVGTSVDFKLYRNDPEVYQKFFAPEAYPGGLSYTVSLEGNYLVQTLEDPDEFGTTTPQRANAVALQARVKWNFFRFHVLGLYRTLSFIQFDVPGFPPFRDFPDGTEQQAEAFVAGGLDYHFPSLHLTTGLIVGAQRPAAFTSPVTLVGGNNPGESFEANRTVVIRDGLPPTPLPTDYQALPIYSAKTTFRWDISEPIASIGEVYYTRDPNRVTFVKDEGGVAQPTFEKEHGLGFNIIVQARF